MADFNGFLLDCTTSIQSVFSTTQYNVGGESGLCTLFLPVYETLGTRNTGFYYCKRENHACHSLVHTARHTHHILQKLNYNLAIVEINHLPAFPHWQCFMMSFFNFKGHDFGL